MPQTTSSVPLAIKETLGSRYSNLLRTSKFSEWSQAFKSKKNANQVLGAKQAFCKLCESWADQAIAAKASQTQVQAKRQKQMNIYFYTGRASGDMGKEGSAERIKSHIKWLRSIQSFITMPNAIAYLCCMHQNCKYKYEKTQFTLEVNPCAIFATLDTIADYTNENGLTDDEIALQTVVVNNVNQQMLDIETACGFKRQIAQPAQRASTSGQVLGGLPGNRSSSQHNGDIVNLRYVDIGNPHHGSAF